MNIEEERKAFVEILKPKLITDFGCGCLAEGHDKDTFDHPGVQFTFEGWLAAKEHAAEMAKPTVKVKPKCLNTEFSQYQWVVSLFEDETFNGVLEDFITKEDAEAWARNCGYRVIE